MVPGAQGCPRVKVEQYENKTVEKRISRKALALLPLSAVSEAAADVQNAAGTARVVPKV